MDRIIRRFLIFQGLAIGILTIVSSLVNMYHYMFNFTHYETWERRKYSVLQMFIPNMVNALDIAHPPNFALIITSSFILYGGGED